jgi:copper chaperone CopZ
MSLQLPQHDASPPPSPPSPALSDAPPSATAELVIDGMTCGACVRSVESALARLPAGAVCSSSVSLGHARVCYVPTLLTDAQLLEGARTSTLAPVCALCALRAAAASRTDPDAKNTRSRGGLWLRRSPRALRRAAAARAAAAG